jgi:peptide-methionine (S)-S-oxide reductase
MANASPTAAPPRETATLAGGCFWCTEAVLSELRGIVSVMPGYCGGTRENPTYEEVCTGRTGHAEAVDVVFDPSVVPYRDLLEIFFATHDPTTRNRQGADVGTQYRSAIFTRSENQRTTAQESVKAAEQIWGRPIVTEIVPLVKFYPAEEYHRDYFRRNPGAGYCQVVIAPKVAKVRKEYLDRLRRPGSH